MEGIMMVFKIVKKKKLLHAEGFLSFSPTQNSSFQLRKLRLRKEM